MNKETLNALHESIDHWFDIIENKPGTFISASQCSLCRRFDGVDHFLNRCRIKNEKCPVYKKTGRTACRRTPYVRFSSDDRKRTALKEIEFLISLLPEKEQEYYYYD